MLNTNRDINFHGGPDIGNTVTVAHSELDYDPSQNTGMDDGYWAIVGDHVSTHANIDPLASNIVTFHVGQGHNRADRINGTAGNDILGGCGGVDVLSGAAGNDILIGGIGKDTMTGGGGADLFLARSGDNYDTITDFSAGDRIGLGGAGTATSFSGLVITDTAAGVTVRYGANGTLTLTGVTAADLAADDFLFSLDAYLTGLF